MHKESNTGVIRSGQALINLFDQYAASCAAEDAFPNLAGFCRFCRIGEENLAKLRRRYPTAYDFIMTALEDEALNADKSASLVTAYLKRRLGYGETADEQEQPILVSRELMQDGE